MTRPINGTLQVTDFLNTNVGEYSFENAIFSNGTDATGNGAFDISVGHILFVQATDINTASPIPGVYHRYKLTSVTPIDSFTVSGTMLWDEPGDEVDTPTNGSFCLLAEPTSINKIGLPPLDANYSDVPPGASLAALLVDVRYIIDKLSNGSFDNLAGDVATLTADVENIKTRVTDIESNLVQIQNQVNQAAKTTFYTHYQNTEDVSWIVEHNKGSTSFVCSVFSPTGDMIIPDSVKVIDANTVVVTLAKPAIGTATLFIHK